MKLANVAVAVAGVLACAGQAMAADSGWYVGAGAGIGDAVLHHDRTQQGLAANGFGATISEDDRDFAWRLFGGYRLSPNLSLEGAFFDLGEYSYRADTTPAGQLNGSLHPRGLSLDLLGQWPLTQRLSALARVGAHYTRVATDMQGSGAVIVDDHDHTWSWNPKVGAGLQYDITPMLAARAEWDHYRIEDDVHGRNAVNTWMASVLVSFGAAPQATPVAQVTEADAAAVTEPAPAPVATGASLKSASYTEESLFGFDSADLKSEGRSTLDQLSTEVRGMPYARIRVIGHASRSGTDEYNLRLSSRRAQAVRDYLVNTGGLDASRMTVIAKGESEPVTQPGDCPAGNEKTDADVQKCLQPDRRVRVEVNAAP